MPHVVMAFLLATLAVGSAAILALERLLRERAPDLFRALVGHLVIFNLLTAAGLGYRLADLAPSPVQVHLLSAQLVALAALKILWLGSFAAIGHALARRAVEKRLVRIVGFGSGGAMLAATTGWALWVSTGRVLATEIVALATDVVVLAGIVITAGWLWQRAAQETNRPSRRAMRSFASGSAAVATVFGTSLAAGALWTRWNGARQSAAHAAVLLAYELLLVLWAARWAMPWAAQGPVDSTGVFERAADRYRLSKREREVAALLCHGRTNQEIADALFVALQTIKDHNHRIFQKVGVRNRTELAQRLGQEASHRSHGDLGRTSPQ